MILSSWEIRPEFFSGLISQLLKLSIYCDDLHLLKMYFPQYKYMTFMYSYHTYSLEFLFSCHEQELTSFYHSFDQHQMFWQVWIYLNWLKLCMNLLNLGMKGLSMKGPWKQTILFESLPKHISILSIWLFSVMSKSSWCCPKWKLLKWKRFLNFIANLQSISLIL